MAAQNCPIMEKQNRPPILKTFSMYGQFSSGIGIDGEAEEEGPGQGGDYPGS
jgi:hypothetical protein